MDNFSYIDTTSFVNSIQSAKPGKGKAWIMIVILAISIAIVWVLIQYNKSQKSQQTRRPY